MDLKWESPPAFTEVSDSFAASPHCNLTRVAGMRLLCGVSRNPQADLLSSQPIVQFDRSPSAS